MLSARLSDTNLVAVVSQVCITYKCKNLKYKILKFNIKHEELISFKCFV